MRRAMSMIELVIAIVVMGIVVASTPLLLQQTSASTTMSVIRQESIMEASTQVWRAMIRDWDKNSYDAGMEKAYIIATDSTNKFLNDRNGTSKESGRRGIFDKNGDHIIDVNATSKNDFGMSSSSTIADAVAIEDLHGLVVGLESNNSLYGDAGELDYVFKDARDINATMTVLYMNDGFTGVNFNDNNITIELNPHLVTNNSSHIKVIATTINVADIDGDGNKEQTVLYSFASNIGESASSSIKKYIP